MSGLPRGVTLLKFPKYCDGAYYLINLESFTEDEVIYYLSFCDNFNKERISTFSLPYSKKRYIVTQAILKIILSRYLNINPGDLKIRYSEQGKPYLNNNPLFFNLSYSAGYSFIGLRFDKPLGIDIEKIRYKNIALEYLESFFTKAEISWITRSSKIEFYNNFISMWCAKEALLKSIGCGLSKSKEYSLEPLKSSSQKSSFFKHLATTVYVFKNIQKDYALAIGLSAI